LQVPAASEIRSASQMLWHVSPAWLLPAGFIELCLPKTVCRHVFGKALGEPFGDAFSGPVFAGRWRRRHVEFSDEQGRAYAVLAVAMPVFCATGGESLSLDLQLVSDCPPPSYSSAAPSSAGPGMLKTSAPAAR
jgi:hypothetical protein